MNRKVSVEHAGSHRIADRVLDLSAIDPQCVCSDGLFREGELHFLPVAAELNIVRADRGPVAVDQPNSRRGKGFLINRLGEGQGHRPEAAPEDASIIDVARHQRRTERIGNQLHRDRSGQSNIPARVCRAHLKREHIRTIRRDRRQYGVQLKRKRHIVFHDLPASQQLDIAHLDIVGHRRMQANDTSFLHLNARRDRIEVQGIERGRHRRSEPLIIERQIVHHLQAAGSVCHKRNPPTDRHVERYLRQYVAGNEVTGVAWIGHVDHINPVQWPGRSDDRTGRD